MSINWKEVASGAFFIFVGLFYGGMALFGGFGLDPLTIGHARSMGPGYFPMVLSGILIGIGLFVASRGFFRHGGSPFGAMPWRAIALLSLSILAFAVLVRGLGLGPAIFLSSVIASFAARNVRTVYALAIGIGLALLSVLIFVYAVRLPLPIFGPWIGG